VTLTTTAPKRRFPPCARRLLLAAALGTAALPASAAELVTARPHEFVVGAPRGYAVAPAIDTAGTRHAAALPSVESVKVAWRRNVPGGIATNLLVDSDGRIFAVGSGRVTQLSADGALQYSQSAGFSSAVAAALLADGSRAALTRDSRVLGWTSSGGLVFDVELEAPPPPSSSSLLPLPDGGVLASIGEWLFEIDATRVVRSFARLPASIQHAFVVAGRALVVDEQGRAFEWDRRELPRLVGAFGSPLVAALVDAGSLLGLTSRHSVERLDRSDGAVRELLRLDPPGALPLLGAIEPERSVIMKADGTWFVLGSETPARPALQRASVAGPAHVSLLVDSAGTVAWWASDVPLHLETASGVGRELADVRCAAPVGLVPAGRSRVVAACNSGVVWLIGPDAASER
jgi:hypothetical protein